jgi:hypothetical protein
MVYLSQRPWWSQKRIRSRVCAAVDIVAVTAGVLFLILAAADSLASWPADHVLMNHAELSHVAAAILIPGWIWLLVSLPIAIGLPKSREKQGPAERAQDRLIRRAMYPKPQHRLGIGLVGILCVGVIVGGFVVGAAKGNARVLPGPRYEVSTLNLNGAEWTPVSAGQYTVWQARYIREDGFFTLFGLFMAGGSLGLLQLHRTAKGIE